MEKRVMEALMELGVPVANKGYRFLVSAITQVISKEGEVDSVTKIIYPDIAKKFNTKPHRVERAIRHAIETVFLKSDVDVIYRYFGNYIGTKLTNRNFIAAVAYHIMNEEV